MLTCLLLKVLCVTRVLNEGLGQSYTEKSRAPSLRELCEVRIIMHVHSLIPYTLNLCPKETCVVQVETGDTGLAADGNASAIGLQ